MMVSKTCIYFDLDPWRKWYTHFLDGCVQAPPRNQRAATEIYTHQVDQQVFGTKSTSFLLCKITNHPCGIGWSAGTPGLYGQRRGSSLQYGRNERPGTIDPRQLFGWIFVGFSTMQWPGHMMHICTEIVSHSLQVNPGVTVVHFLTEGTAGALGTWAAGPPTY